MFSPSNPQRYYLRLPLQDYSWSVYQQRIQPQQIWSNQQQTLKTTNMIEPTTNNKKTNMIEPTTNNEKNKYDRTNNKQ